MTIPADQLLWGAAIAQFAIPAALAVLGFIGQQEQAKAQRRAQRRSIELENAQIAREIAAANRANDARLAAIQAQTNIANQGSETFTRDVQDQLGNLKGDLKESETQRRGNLDRALTRKDPAGEAGAARQVGSEVKGRVSESFTERGQRAGAENVSRANRLADQAAVLGSFRDLPVTRAGQLNTIAFNQLPFQRRKDSRAAIDRLRIGQAGLVPPEPRIFLNTSDPLGDVLTGISEGGLEFFGKGGFGEGPTTTSGGGGTGVSNIQTLTLNRRK